MVSIAEWPDHPHSMPFCHTWPEDLPETCDGGWPAPFDHALCCYPAGVGKMVVVLDQQVERFAGCDDQRRLPGDGPFREPLHRRAGSLRSIGDEVCHSGCLHDLVHGLESSF